MKKISVIVLSMLLLIGLCSCGKNVTNYPGSNIPDFSEVTGIEEEKGDGMNTIINAYGGDTKMTHIYFIDNNEDEKYIQYLKKHGFSYNYHYSTDDVDVYGNSGDYVGVSELNGAVIISVFGLD